MSLKVNTQNVDSFNLNNIDNPVETKIENILKLGEINVFKKKPRLKKY